MEGFTLYKDTYAAIPCGKKGKELMVIYNGQQLKVCRTVASARKFIEAHRKSQSVAELPLN